MNENIEFEYTHLTKWLRVLMYITITSLVNSAVNFLPFVPSSVTTWISRGIMVAMIVCLFRLAPVNERYKNAGILRSVMLGCTLITAFVSTSTLLTLTASVLSIIAVYQEYSAHSELVAQTDVKLSRNWHSLFNWSIIAGILVGFGSVIVVLIVTMLKLDAVRVASLIVGILGIPQFVVEVVYLLYIKKMIVILSPSRTQ